MCPSALRRLGRAARARLLPPAVQVEDDGEPVVKVRLRGEVDAANAGEAGRLLCGALRPGVTVLEVDLVGVRHVSADGSRAFFAVLSEARACGTRMTVSHADPFVQRILHQVGFIRLLQPPGGEPPPTAGAK